jgi:tetratricopeptide (TPR) repeat protein
LERSMRLTWRSGLAVSVIVLAIASDSLLLPSAAQIDPAAAQKRFQDLYEAGNYSAALAEAQKAEASAKRAGTNNFAYVSALNDLARAHLALGRYADAASMFKQVYSAYYKGTCHRPIPA